MPHLTRILLPGLACAGLVALVGRGALLHFVIVVYLAVGGIIAAGLILFIGRLRRRNYRTVAATVAAAGVLQLASLPLGALINRWDVGRAKAWCEETVLSEGRAPGAGAPATPGQKPKLADYDGESCIVHDRTSILHWWEYDPATGQWLEVD